MGNIQLEQVYEDTIIRIQLDKNIQLLQLTFLTTPNTDQFRNGYRLAFDTAARKNIKYWLTDARLIKTMLPENQRWLAQHMQPLLQALSPQKFAIIISPECFVMTNPSQTYNQDQSKKESAAGGPIKIHFDEEPAYQWLLA